MAATELTFPALIVLDTMIVVGGVIGRTTGADAKILHRIETGGVRLASSDAWLRELQDVLTRPVILERVTDPGRLVRAALTVGIMGALYRPTRFDWPSLSDPKDWWMLDLAFEAGADVIVTRDNKVLKAAPRLGFQAMTPPEFLRNLSA
jgi:putative PIN family toxin of toxin-antitoxin system